MRRGAPERLRMSPTANRPIISQARTTSTVPVIVMVSETVGIRPGRLRTRSPAVGFCRTGCAPAPSAPTAIKTAPVAPNRRIPRSCAVSFAFRPGRSSSSPCSTAAILCRGADPKGRTPIVESASALGFSSRIARADRAVVVFSGVCGTPGSVAAPSSRTDKHKQRTLSGYSRM